MMGKFNLKGFEDAATRLQHGPNGPVSSTEEVEVGAVPGASNWSNSHRHDTDVFIRKESQRIKLIKPQKINQYFIIFQYIYIWFNMCLAIFINLDYLKGPAYV